MPMPIDLVFVRHGQSEANIVQKGHEPQPSTEIIMAVNDRPDWQQRLSSLGISQAKLAKIFIDKELGGVSSFDGRYLSPFLRTRETAAYIGGDDCDEWTVDDRVVERSWGVYGTVARAEQRKQFPLTSKLHEATPWYVRFDGGESMPDVYNRFRDFQGTLHREQSGKRVIVVSHGDFINVARYGIERMLPEQWEALDRDPAYTIRNCSITHYSRVNPNDATDIRDKLHWRRIIYPDAIDQSPDNGQWVELPGRQRFSGAELRQQAEFAAPLLIKNEQVV
ncbi:MAG TPA: histidine phosphatase family protein [Candidatus Saccharimonadales bacterium]